MNFREIGIVQPRRGCPDQFEMFAIDDEGCLWHRLSLLDGPGWTAWTRDNGIVDPGELEG